jgi:hypothetical protein
MYEFKGNENSRLIPTVESQPMIGASALGALPSRSSSSLTSRRASLQIVLDLSSRNASLPIEGLQPALHK